MTAGKIASGQVEAAAAPGHDITKMTIEQMVEAFIPREALLRELERRETSRRSLHGIVHHDHDVRDEARRQYLWAILRYADACTESIEHHNVMLREAIRAAMGDSRLLMVTKKLDQCFAYQHVLKRMVDAVETALVNAQHFGIPENALWTAIELLERASDNDDDPDWHKAIKAFLARHSRGAQIAGRPA